MLGKKTKSVKITKDKGYYLTDKSIGVSTFNGKGKYGYTTTYIPKTKENIDKINKVKGKPFVHNNRTMWQ